LRALTGNSVWWPLSIATPATETNITITIFAMHQISNTFTRLLPAIEFADSAFTQGHDTVRVLLDPPAMFDAVHSPSLLNTWYKKLQDALCQPVQVEQRQGHRRVQVLGTAIFDFAPDNTLRVFVWDFEQNDRVMLTEMPARDVVIRGVPYLGLWMQRFTLGATRALLRRHPDTVELCRAYVTWAQAELQSRCWDQDTQDRVRYQIAVELDVDLCVKAFADQVDVSEAPTPMRVSFYNQAVQFGLDCHKLEQEAPHLLPLYILMAGSLTSADAGIEWEPTARMQRWLLQRGLQPATWRLLCHAGTQWITEFLAYFDLKQQTRASSVLEVLLMAQAFGSQQLAPAWLLQALVQLGGNPNDPGTGYVQRLDDLFPLCARLGHLAAQADAGTLVWMQDRILHLFSWASNYMEEMPTGYARRATLRGLIRKVDAQQKLDVMRLTGSEPWRTGYSLNLLNIEDDSVQAVVLGSPLAVWTEGRDMRHCAANYIDRCARGHWLMVSLRRSSCSRSLATVAFDMRTPLVRQVKISGFANTLVSPEVRALALECQRQLQIQRRRRKVNPSAASSIPAAASVSTSSAETTAVRPKGRLKSPYGG
jgi:hypothetical protein